MGEQTCLIPISQAELALRLSLNESTLSRAINGKYLLSSCGMYPVSYFFSRASYGKESEKYSQNFIKAMIAKIIENEDPINPFSDQDIANYMEERGISMARRTVAKYRTEMDILTSRKRKECFLCK